MSDLRIPGKTGRLFHEEVATVKAFSEYLTSPLPRPPATFSYASAVKKQGGFPMALNDQLGDCTIAGIVHLLQLAYAVVGQMFEYPGDAAVRSQYLSLTGGADSGLVETDVLQYGATKGMFGETWKWAPIPVHDSATLEAACYAFGGVYLGVALDQYAQVEFQRNQPWKIISGYDPIVGGHCVVGSGAAGLGPEIVTWGNTAVVTSAWWKKYGTNAYVIIPSVFERVGHGPLANVNMTALEADLEAFAG